LIVCILVMFLLLFFCENLHADRVMWCKGIVSLIRVYAEWSCDVEGRLWGKCSMLYHQKKESP